LSHPESTNNKGQIPEFIFKDEGDLPWIPSKFADGVEVKNLGKANGRALQLVRFQAGASYPSHVHHDCEFIYVIEGEVFQNGRRLAVGSSTVASTGTLDETFVSPTGCLFLLFYGVGS
jgi:anti-sigma factor ChrR (cupin superfamily)